MMWYNYLSAFGAGLFIANFIPHFVNGVSGNRFPTPFSKPSGIGLSSPTLNVIWALFNLLIGYLLYRAAHITSGHYFSLFIFFMGISFISIFSSKQFSKKQKE